MADVLMYLDAMARQVAELLMPTELEDVVAFLRGTAPPPTPNNNNNNNNTCIVKKGYSLPGGILSCYGFVHVAIATSNALITTHRSTLRSMLEEGGCGSILDTTLSGSSQQQRRGAHSLHASSSTMDVVDEDAEGFSSIISSATSTRSSRIACVDALRQRCDEILDEARARFDNARTPQHIHGCTSMVKQHTQRLTLILRCCGENRRAFSTRGPSPKKRGGGSSSSSSSRRRVFLHHSDPLLLLLHEVGSIAALYHARLRRTHTALHVGVLLLPEDQLLGGAALHARVSASLNHRFVVRLFASSSPTCGAHRYSLRDAQSVAAMWEPHLVGPLLNPTTSTPNNSGMSVVMEEVLERTSSFFFARPSNIALACFLVRCIISMFAIVVRPSMLREMMAAWVIRHDLDDVAMILHGILAPFQRSSAFANTRKRQRDDGDGDDDAHQQQHNHLHAQSTPTTAVELHNVVVMERKRLSPEDILLDLTELMDAVLATASILTDDDHHQDAHDVADVMSVDDDDADDGVRKEQLMAVWAMLLYQDISAGHIARLLRMELIVNALAAMYQREWRALSATSTTTLTQTEQAVVALQRLVPLCGNGEDDDDNDNDVVGQPRPSLYCMHSLRRGGGDVDVASGARMHTHHHHPQRQPPNVMIPMTASLQRTALMALLDPSTSLRELCHVRGDTPSTHQYQRHSSSSAIPNFYDARVPASLRAMCVLTAQLISRGRGGGANSSASRGLLLVQLQQVCQLTDEQLLLVVHELHMCGLAVMHLPSLTVRSLLE